MKNLFLLLIFLSSCQKSIPFKKGDCIQKPDQVVKWKVLAIEDSKLKISSLPPAPKLEKVVTMSDSWIISECHI